MRVGERVLEGRIMEKEEAQKTHEQAVREGKKSTLLVQNRPNIFTSRVANIGPGEEIAIEIQYQQTVQVSGGVFSIRYPLVVGPRYIPGQPIAKSELTALATTETGWALNTDQVPDAAEITPLVDLTGTIDSPVEMTIDLAAGLPLARIDSLYHKIVTEEQADSHYLIRLESAVEADRDFVLEWQATESTATRAAMFSEKNGENQYMQLLIMPPHKLVSTPVPREVVLVLDISGSMAGQSIEQARGAVSMALQRLSERDRFNIVVFSNSAKTLFDESKPADKQSLAKARRFVDNLKADGGTEMKPALLLALDGSRRHERIRQVVFLTDGAVGNEDELLELIHRRLGDSRLFTVGIGSAPNSYFMSRAATMGRGTHLYIGKQSEVKEQMLELFTKLETPAITDLELDLGGDINNAEVYPSPLPDLYHGEPLVLYIRTGWEIPRVLLKGKNQGVGWQVAVDTTSFGARAGIGALWARQKIRNQMESLALGAESTEVRKVVRTTALEHHLVSKYTSLVAVDTTISRPARENVDQAPVPTLLPQGWQPQAVFGGGPQTATSSQLLIAVGSGLLLLALISFILMQLLCRRKYILY